jgi:hypothetical protein
MLFAYSKQLVGPLFNIFVSLNDLCNEGELMSNNGLYYQLMVKPGILKDSTYGLYAIPQDNPNTEIHLDGQFKTLEEASIAAEVYRDVYKDRLFSQDIIVKASREALELGNISVLNEKELEDSISKTLERYFSPIKEFNLKKLFGITHSTPYLIAWIALAAYWFSFSITVPKWLPVIGEYLGGKTFTPNSLAAILPYFLCLIVAYIFFKTRIQAANYSDAKDQIIALATLHNWKMENFQKMLTRVISSQGHGWLGKLGERMAEWDSDTLREIRNNSTERGREEQFARVIDMILRESFESRIHALAYMNKEKSFGHSYTAFEPFFFLVQISRTKQRMRIITNANTEQVERDIRPLPTQNNPVQRTIFAISFINYSTLAAALSFSLYLHTPAGIFGWLGILSACIVTILPAPFWNYNLLMRNRGLPRGWSATDVNSPGYRILVVL